MIFTDHILDFQFGTTLKENFDITVIIPIHLKISTFRFSLEKNKQYFQRNGIEVILVLTNKIYKKEILEILRENPLVNWIVTLVEANKLQEGILQSIGSASKRFAIVIPQNFVLENDLLYLFRYQLEYYKNSYCTNISNQTYQNKLTPLILTKTRDVTLAIKSIEKFITINSLLVQISLKLNQFGLSCLFISDSKISKFNNNDYAPINAVPKEHLPVSEEKLNRPYIYHWRHKSFSEEFCLEYLSNFPAYEIAQENVFLKEYPIVALVQARNEIKYLKGFIENISGFVDGIIFLDDGSSDLTFEKTISPKLLIKVKKNHKSFNDLENRNILLDFASFINSKWLVFIDVDERFDAQFENLRNTVCQNQDMSVIGFNLVNVWNKGNKYLSNLQDTNPLSKAGIFIRWRMFRNIGRCQILDKMNLHFRCVPYLSEGYLSEVLIRHLIPDSEKFRKAKLAFYKESDINFIENFNKGIYAYLTITPKLSYIDDIKLPKIRKIV